MNDKDIKDPAKEAAEKPVELSEEETEQVAGGAKPSYGTKGVKFE